MHGWTIRFENIVGNREKYLKEALAATKRKEWNQVKGKKREIAWNTDFVSDLLLNRLNVDII